MSITNELPFIPQSLNRLKNPPKRLFYRGNLDLLNYKKVAIVGSRKISVYTKNLVLSLSAELKKRNICVVSGGAIGTDITAHFGAFPHTIGVFANGLDIIYPSQNSKLIKQIEQESLVLSEYEDGQSPKNWNFLQRNRIVVGLCDAVVVAQADFKSGSIQSARMANETKIPLFVFPQRINESEGTNFLIAQNRANLIDSIENFANKFGKISTKKDEILEFIQKNPNFDDCFNKFGDKIYEYEIEGKIAIDGLFIRIL